MDQKVPVTSEMRNESSGAEALELEQSQNNSEFYGEIASTEETQKRQALERRVKWKLDLIILPLLSTVYFLAQMVCTIHIISKILASCTILTLVAGPF